MVNTGYIVCTTPRSGSTLLCTSLEATNQAGRPWSFYHEPHFMQEWADAWGLPTAGSLSPIDHDKAYLDAAVVAGKGGTGRFGMRLQHTFLRPLASILARLFPDLPGDAERFERAFGPLRYCHLTRSDKVAQAVSLIKARQTGLWHRNADGSEKERLAPTGDAIYDFAAIAAEVASLRRADRAWNQWFEQQRIVPLTVSYEVLDHHRVATMRQILRSLEVEISDGSAVFPALVKLADATNQDWITRYGADERALASPLKKIETSPR